jgi:RNA polymerase sigma factor (sigma-70 family)
MSPGTMWSTGYFVCMRDSEVVATIVAGDPEGLAVAYDRYAGDLYGYCRSLLHQPDDAADAVQDTFVIAASKVGGLREPDRLRAWLFAVARNECLRRLKSRRPAVALQDVPEPADPSVDIGVEAERAEAIALVRAAAGGLNDSERDVINQLWHGLEVPEVAAVLGVSRNHAWSLFSRARDQLEASVGVLLVGRTGRRDCAALDRLLGDWDGRLNARLRRKVGRHIDQCRVCSERRQRELRPAMLYGLAPGAVLAMAALRGGGLAAAAHAAAHAGGPLAGVRDAVLGIASQSAGTAGHAAAAHAGTGSALSFAGNGFPKPLPGGHLGFLPRPHLTLTVAGGTVVAAAATAVVTAVVPGHHGRVTDSAGPPPYSVTVPGLAPQARTGPGGTGPGAAPGSPGAAARARPGLAPGVTGASGATGPVATGPDGRPVATGSGGASGGALPPGAATGTASPTGDPAGPTDPASPTANPGGSDPSTTAPVPTAPASAVASTPPSPGTLAVSPSTVLLTPLLGGSMTLTASGGPVSWSIDEPSSLLGQLIVSPASGTLNAGESATVTITVNGLASVDTQLTVEPGGHAVTVVLGLL